MDAFYVSVELLRHPELVGKPVVVSGTGPRAVVTTASYEARKFGVGSAMPASRARRLCPEAIFVPVDHAHYRERSREIRELIDQLGVPVEPLSLDEAYLDVSDLPDPVAQMSGLVRRIRDELHLDASVGIGPNKLVAKVGSDAEKPRGFVVLTREQAVKRFAPEPVTLIPGIGRKTAERLKGHGVVTLAQLQRCTVPGLIERFGENHGRALHERAHFRSDSTVTTHREAKSRSVETTFDRDIADLAEMEAVVERQARRLAGELESRSLAGRTIGIKVRTDDFDTFTRVRSVKAPVNDAEEIAAVALDLLRENAPARPVRLLGVKVAGFETATPTTPTPATPATPGAPTLLDLEFQP